MRARLELGPAVLFADTGALPASGLVTVRGSTAPRPFLAALGLDENHYGSWPPPRDARAKAILWADALARLYVDALAAHEAGDDSARDDARVGRVDFGVRHHDIRVGVAVHVRFRIARTRVDAEALTRRRAGAGDRALRAVADAECRSVGG